MDWLHGLLGGVLIGASAALLLWTNGRIAGVSGVFAGTLLPQRGELGWRLGFIGALFVGGAIFSLIWPDNFAIDGVPSWPWWIVSGLLVGVGTRIGGGCTSGHGVCGIGRGSPRSMIATLVFVGAAMLTVIAVRR
ncbi:MAG TPA: YeeE/YedE family protein [Polyangiales bacterium]|nr:YeeE/YedE family protein [Polyangiales bacterium]